MRTRLAHRVISLERETIYTSNQTFQVADTVNVGLRLHTQWVAKAPHTVGCYGSTHSGLLRLHTHWVAMAPHTLGC